MRNISLALLNPKINRFPNSPENISIPIRPHLIHPTRWQIDLANQPAHSLAAPAFRKVSNTALSLENKLVQQGGIDNERDELCVYIRVCIRKSKVERKNKGKHTREGKSRRRVV